jgi:hypothetical protein
MNLRHNNNDDSEDEEDDIIMYKEQSVVPWSHHEKSQSEPSQQQLELSQHHTEPEMNNISIVPRQERKRRRQEWKERLLADQQPSDNDDSESDGPLENTFASLQCLLDDKDTPEDENDDSQRETTAPQNQEELEIKAKENYEYTAQQQQPPPLESEPSKRQGAPQSQSPRRMMESEGPLESSPPDFVVYEDNDDPDDGHNQTTMSAIHDPPRTVLGNRSPTKSNHLNNNDKYLDTTLLDGEVKRQRRRSKKLQEIRDSANSNSTSMPEHNLDLNRSPTLKKSSRRRKPPSLREISQTQTTNASQPTPMLHNSKSIVGSRYVSDYSLNLEWMANQYYLYTDAYTLG